MIQTVNINVAALPALRGPGSFMVLSQNENGRQIRFRILGSDLPTGCTATFSGTKPDGNVYSTTGTVSGNFVIVQEDIQMTAVAGIWDAKLEIAKGTENIVTSIIRVTVVRDPVAGDAIPSDSQLDGIVTEVKYYAEHARSEAYGSPLTASIKSAMTDKTRVYVYTGSESGMTAGNWYYWNGTAWTSGGVYNSVAVQSDSEINNFSTNPVQNKVIKAALDQIEGAIPEIDATLSVSGKAADAKKTGDEISGLKEDLNIVPSVKDSDAEDVDLDVSDSQGNVIVRFADGHIKTKNFDSSQINVDTDTAVMSQITDGDADLYISDAQGKGLVRFADGHIQTAEFTSDNGVYKKVFEYTDTAGTATINHFFPKGTRLAFHLVRADVAGWCHLANYAVTYKYTDRDSITHTLGADYGYNFPTYTLPKDAVSVSVAYGIGLTQHETTDLAFCVYPEASFKKQPKIITVSPDGSKDFTTIRGAVDSIPVDVCELNPYEIHVYSGVYDILAEYSDAEIMTDGFEGLYLNNGTSLIGVGSKDEIVLMGILDTDDYDNTKCNAVSTLNVSGNVLIENVTITAENIRYCIHDEGSLMTHKYNVHRFKNLKMYGSNLTSGAGGNMTYGAGCSSYKQVECDNVDFGDAMGLHSQNNMHYENSYAFRNCSARLWNLADYNSLKDTHFVMDNCKASIIRITCAPISGSGHDQFMRFDGIGTCGALVKCPVGYVYNLGDCQKFDHANISAGYAVSIDSIAFSGISVTDNISDIYGISVGVIDGYSVIQTSGYINSNILGLTGLSVGDYLTIDNTGKVVSGGTASNAVAVVKMVDTDSVAYAKLLI